LHQIKSAATLEEAEAKGLLLVPPEDGRRA